MRSSIFWTLAPVLAVWLLAGCSGGGGGEQAGGAQEEQSAGPVVGEFVGDIPEAGAFVSLVAEDGEDTQEVRGYLCDGRQLNEWFWGSLSGQELRLASDNGVRLDARLASEGASGTLTLADGASFPFEAELATGVAGLYEVSVSEEGLLRGSSEGGGRLEGRIAEEPNEEGLYPVTATVTAPDGQTQEVETLGPDAESAEGRWVVLADGRVKGGKKGVQTGGYSDATGGY